MDLSKLELVVIIILDNGWIIAFSAVSLALSGLFFSRHRHLMGLTLLAISTLMIVIGQKFIRWSMTLGTDSYLEANHFGFDEAAFWGGTFIHMVPQFVMPLTKPQVLVICTSVGFSAALYAAGRRAPSVSATYAGILVAGFSVVLFFFLTRLHYGKEFADELKAEFSSPSLEATSEHRNVDFLIYIGESITTLNMQVYGYPLPTTPGLVSLQEDPGFLLFSGIRSTHTHTSPSLIDALAILVQGPDGSLSKVGIGNALRNANVPSSLFSTQPESGAFSKLRSLVFEGMTSDAKTTSDAGTGVGINRRLDHTVLEDALNTPGVVFFHSYAGHGPYEENIDDDLSTPIATPAISFEGIFGSSMPALTRTMTTRNRAAYDRAITYLDGNLVRAIRSIKHRDKPAALLFFSDHGEAVYANRGHDSSNYIDEMATVPVIAYFNDAYRVHHGDTFARFRASTTFSEIRLLDQIAPSILEVLGLGIRPALFIPSLSSKTPHPRPVIVERDTLFGRKSISLAIDLSDRPPETSPAGGTPDPTFISLINRKFGAKNSICYHRSNSFAKALRGASVTDCLEVDLVVRDKSLDIRHPPAAITGFTLEDVFGILEGRDKKIWIDGKNIDQHEACTVLLEFLEANNGRVGEIFVEFPGRTLSAGPAVTDCVRRVASIGVRTSLYIPSNASECTQPAVHENGCIELSMLIDEAVRSELFTDLSFDFSNYSAVKSVSSAKSLRWNTWSVRTDTFHMIPREDFDYVIMETYSDPNGI